MRRAQVLARLPGCAARDMAQPSVRPGARLTDPRVGGSRALSSAARSASMRKRDFPAAHVGPSAGKIRTARRAAAATGALLLARAARDGGCGGAGGHRVPGARL